MKILLELLKEFQMEQIDKFVKRIHKHPLSQSVTDDGFDWRNQNIEEIELHLIEEFLERFPQFLPRFPEFKDVKLTEDGPEKEDVDLGNLAFVDWAIRKKRSS